MKQNTGSLALLAKAGPPAATPIGDADDREAWLEARRSGLGASEAAAALGLDPWRTPRQLYVEKTGDGSDESVTRRIEWKRRLGQAIEPAILAELGHATGIQVEHSRTLYRSQAHPWLLATPDGLARAGSDLVVAEAKLVGARGEPDWQDGIPLHYQPQLAQQAVVLGVERVFLAVLFYESRRSDPWEWHEFRLTPDVAGYLVDATRRMWERIERRDPPPLQDGDLTAESLRRLYPRDNGSTIELPADAAALDEEFIAATAAAKEATERRDRVKARIEAMLGEAAVGIVPGGNGNIRYTWKATERGGYTVAPATVRTLRRSEFKPKGRS